MQRARQPSWGKMGRWTERVCSPRPFLKIGFFFFLLVVHHRCVSLISAITWLAFCSACGETDKVEVEKRVGGGVPKVLQGTLGTCNMYLFFLFTNVCMHLKLNYDRMVAVANFRLFYRASDMTLEKQKYHFWPRNSYNVSTKY